MALTTATLIGQNYKKFGLFRSPYIYLSEWFLVIITCPIGPLRTKRSSFRGRLRNQQLDTYCGAENDNQCSFCHNKNYKIFINAQIIPNLYRVDVFVHLTWTHITHTENSTWSKVLSLSSLRITLVWYSLFRWYVENLIITNFTRISG